MRRPGKIGTILGILALLTAFLGVSLTAQGAKPAPKDNEGVFSVQQGY